MAVGLRKEHVVLAGTAAVLGLLFWQGRSAAAGDGIRKSRSKGKHALELPELAVPDTGLARPLPRTASTAPERDLFAPPRDTRPLAPLGVVPPPLPRFTALAPPAVPSVAPDQYGRFLRADATPRPVPGLFTGLGALDDAGQREAFDEAAAGVDGGTLDALAALGYAAADDSGGLTPAQRAALLESYKAQFDWIRINEGEPLFGRIANSDRFGLPAREGEAVQFVELRPESGVERYPGMEPVAFARERVLDFGFAGTVSNHLHLRRAELAGELSASVYADLLAFADECVAQRNEAREALRFAEEAYRRASEFDGDDPAPVVGLARCYEAGFRFEDAWRTYAQLVERYPHRADGHIGLGQLEERLRLFDSAEEHLRRAESLERGSWRVQWALGRFLFRRGRAAEALAHLESAYRFEPGEPSAASTRAEIRADLGAARLALGELAEARASFEAALAADGGHGVAHAGRTEVARLQGEAAAATADTELPGAGLVGAGFEPVLAGALASLAAGDAPAARDGLLLAAELDPVQAGAAWRGLAWLAETTGQPEEAWRFVEAANEADPTDAWTLYQRGRLQLAEGDLEGARESLMGALDRELDLVDALVALGLVSYRAERQTDAALFLERALGLDPERPEVHALRGLVLLELGELGQAGEAFDAALTLDGADPVAHAGRAWIAYLRGDADRAVTLFAELDDRRRSLPEGDPWRAYAKAQLERVVDHVEKEAWTDGFERRKLMKGWATEEAAGPEVRLDGGELVIEGVFKQNGVARVYRLLPAPDFVSLELDVTVAPENNARVAVFLAKERRRGGGVVETQGMFAAAREKTGGLALLAMDVARAEPEWTDVPAVAGEAWWPAGEPVRVRLEVVGEGSEATGRVFVNGVPVQGELPVRRIVGSTAELKLGVLVEGQTGLPARVVVDDVELVYRTGAR